ncbi:hypothetical protein EDC94DRAFT_645886 [Helicostylum pulchrum]|nr:hypothetical protein EDC94DRAFT_645886 [Helicostylum pulchrum]
MNISALNAPATPPYDYQNHSSIENSTKNYSDIFFDRQPKSSDHDIETSSDNETSSNHSAFRRVSSMSMPSPPELLIDSSEDEEETASYTSLSSSYNMHQKNSRKSVPHRSPSNLVDHKSIVFQIENDSTPKILGGANAGILWSLRQRVSLARRQQHKNRLSAPRPERRVRAMRIQIPRPQWSNTRDNTIYDDLVSPQHHVPVPVKIIHNNTPMRTEPMIVAPATTTTTALIDSTAVWDSNKKVKPTTTATERKKSSTNRKNSSTHASSGRPSRVKGPCQACHETSDGCMRKAFNWPFPTSTIFNDKGKPFVYLCNKCGLRYNKSGGCVCRHCRWVLCKEEKRKAMQLIDQMRRSRPDGKVDPDEDIENFACSPKYWSCGRSWKVGWVLHSQHDDADEDEEMMDRSPSLSDATL